MVCVRGTFVLALTLTFGLVVLRPSLTKSMAIFVFLFLSFNNRQSSFALFSAAAVVYELRVSNTNTKDGELFD